MVRHSSAAKSVGPDVQRKIAKRREREGERKRERERERKRES